MAEQKMTVTMVNHVAIDIAAAPAAVWRAILDDYVDGAKFGEAGYCMEPLDDPAAILGGYRMRFAKDGVVLDERIVQVTERDDAARRLSMYADYLSVPGGMQVYATYHAQEAEGGARYAIDCHSRIAVEAGADIAAALADIKAQADAALAGFLAGVKARLEAAG